MLDQNAPNPFDAATTIRYNLPEAGELQIRVFDAAGRLVQTLVDGTVNPGIHLTSWDGTNDRGEAVGSGIYFYRLEAGDRVQTRRMILAR